MTKHQWVEHKNCDRIGCPICDGGLAICKVCGLIEGSLTSECPGYQCYTSKSDDIYAGKLDFRNGQWITATSPYSPNYGETK
jgi:hypothetical protein